MPDFVDCPREALLPLKSGWEAVVERGGKGSMGKGEGGGTGVDR